MTARYYFLEDNSRAARRRARQLDYRPTLWVKPQGEKNNAETGWIYGEGNPHGPAGIVNPGALVDACWWRIQKHFEARCEFDRLIPNHEFFQWMLEPGEWPLTRRENFNQHKITIETIRYHFKGVKLGLWGLPLVHGGKNAIHEGFQYVGALTEMLDLSCPSAYPHGNGDGPYDDDLSKVEERLRFAQTWEKEMHVYLGRWWQHPKKVFHALTGNQYREYCELVASYHPQAVECWSMATTKNPNLTFPGDPDIPDIDVETLEITHDVFG